MCHKLVFSKMIILNFRHHLFEYFRHPFTSPVGDDVTNTHVRYTSVASVLIQHTVRQVRRRWHERGRYLKAIKIFRAASKGVGTDSKNEFVESPRGPRAHEWQSVSFFFFPASIGR